MIEFRLDLEDSNLVKGLDRNLVAFFLYTFGFVLFLGFRYSMYRCGCISELRADGLCCL